MPRQLLGVQDLINHSTPVYFLYCMTKRYLVCKHLRFESCKKKANSDDTYSTLYSREKTRPNRPQVWPEDDMSRMVRGTESRRTPPPSFRVLRPVEPSWVLDAIAVAVATWSDEGGTWGGLAVAVGSSRS